MALDQDRIRAIYENKHTYYGSRRAAVRQDYRPHPSGSGDYVAAQVSPSMEVLNLGCGDGDTLLDHNASFRAGLGIDNDPQHLQMAQDARRERGIENVRFLLMDFPRESAQLDAESFDLVFSRRGP